ncbi:MAG: hypothetical protein A2W52_03395 [Candidatus Taylorbacteria bacterium RIFCSPHIGHO2_02_49_25]|uniref:Uncharacterized protein n=1 Tax=Candidatus Taylorbacteria bacterium RIFCSPHIGHO2_02_49_25 TaxID=1802305 RepID=A0A1G2MG73_9BACT|nr:MAG: hypothetical protein UY62_C0067G0004 [Parcubacteria group bacterium GW2011_GWF2_50_9]OHA20077.1 MAG: hypothetical protein A2759_04215 [Candidatus Taylorbacteria bacterium RIFCSPHIGHO2_01_FULL_49_60]OHA22915.1 MAG: hypothetical protein A2W52_03395 [Candidatus Taylorbacteria bacterium RIFCSPHIGHO2_02_49_25]OHA35474.1 MAG: hypothetical protein A3B27_01080 [Candidatus Taylorbacteria bacterium RIFCSPLOWO2_01_FULL_50_130]OHA36490.1 MAG: hypothetical protein A2W65_01195 [Candidatus Taylorbacte
MVDIPKDYLDTLKQRSRPLKITSERQELIQRFVDQINVERVGTKFKPVIWKQINGLIAHVKIGDLYWLFKECGQGNSFSKKFFGILKSVRVKK